MTHGDVQLCVVCMGFVLSDYGLRMYRRDDGAEPLSSYQQRLLEVYMPPEFHNSNVEPTLAGDVFRYQELTFVT